MLRRQYSNSVVSGYGRSHLISRGILVLLPKLAREPSIIQRRVS